MKICQLLALLLLIQWTSSVVAQDNTDSVAEKDNNEARSSVEISFEESLPTEWKTQGTIRFNTPGPRPPEFPELSDKNSAITLESGGYLAIPDAEEKSTFDLTNGDAVTFEAWVNPSRISDGGFMYIIGKGRTGSPKFAKDNQNWAFRLTGKQGEAKVNFLFATSPNASGSHWHRWTSVKGFPVDTGWHHVAVTYRFGDPKTIQGWINGKPTKGVWDMGGATSEPPVVDNDEIRIGSGFVGSLDAVALHHRILSDEELTARFKRVGKTRTRELRTPIMPEIADVPAGRVLVQIHENMPTHERWLYTNEEWPAVTTSWVGDEFLLPRIPLKYDSWGIRTKWEAPLLVRMVGDIQLPPGEHKILLWTRALSRLWIDGELLAEKGTINNKPRNGEELVIPVNTPPQPGLRARGYGQSEIIKEFVAKGDGDAPRTYRVVLDMMVGGSNLRAETGEVCIAVETEDGRSYSVLRPNVSNLAELTPLTDDAVEPLLTTIEDSISQLETEQRRTAAASRDSFWEMRHKATREWVAAHPSPEVPAAGDGESLHPIDAFINAKIKTARTAAEKSDPVQAKDFYENVLPILSENCFRCHGDKDNGGLRLNTREHALSAGDSDVPAIIPGDPDQSELIARVRAGDMPPTENGLTPTQIQTLEKWVKDGAAWPAPPLNPKSVQQPEIVSDSAFLRRIYLDLVGVPPTDFETKKFLSDRSTNKRERVIEQLLQDDRAADHWMGFWLDTLAENPSLINKSLNSSGPFRFFLYESLLDRKPLDRMLTELLLMRGDVPRGGSVGFSVAGENDSPFAAKAHIISSAFLGIEMQCARCHDSPYHETTQRDLYNLAAMLNRKPLTVPETSRVPAAFFEKQGRESLIQVTLKPDEQVQATWPFANVTGVEDSPELNGLMESPGDPRERLATLITAPQNKRFPRVIVNHLWKRLMGAGFVEPVNDWEGHPPSHPELLDWLADQFRTHNYDVNHVVKLIVTSKAYQREAVGQNLTASAEQRFFNAPERRRLTAEQIVDSLHAVTGRKIDSEELTFVHDGRRSLNGNLTLGTPTRAWMFADLKNERDRPSLSLPRARSVVDVLEAFGWTGSRQKPIHERETAPNVLQPGVLANSTLASSLTRASLHSEMAELALQAQSPEELAKDLFLRFLTREPSPEELSIFSAALAEGFSTRIVPENEVVMPEPLKPLPQVSWFNHLRPEANEIQIEIERRVQQGPPADPRLQTAWREVFEDILWSLINHREFAWVP